MKIAKQILLVCVMIVGIYGIWLGIDIFRNGVNAVGTQPSYMMDSLSVGVTNPKEVVHVSGSTKAQTLVLPKIVNAPLLQITNDSEIAAQYPGSLGINIEINTYDKNDNGALSLGVHDFCFLSKVNFSNDLIDPRSDAGDLEGDVTCELYTGSNSNPTNRYLYNRESNGQHGMTDCTATCLR